MGRKFVEDLSALGAKRYMLDGPDSASVFGQGQCYCLNRHTLGSIITSVGGNQISYQAMSLQQ